MHLPPLPSEEGWREGELRVIRLFQEASYDLDAIAEEIGLSTFGMM